MINRKLQTTLAICVIYICHQNVLLGQDTDFHQSIGNSLQPKVDNNSSSSPFLISDLPKISWEVSPNGKVLPLFDLEKLREASLKHSEISITKLLEMLSNDDGWVLSHIFLTYAFPRGKNDFQPWEVFMVQRGNMILVSFNDLDVQIEYISRQGLTQKHVRFPHKSHQQQFLYKKWKQYFEIRNYNIESQGIQIQSLLNMQPSWNDAWDTFQSERVFVDADEMHDFSDVLINKLGVRWTNIRFGVIAPRVTVDLEKYYEKKKRGSIAAAYLLLNDETNWPLAHLFLTLKHEPSSIAQLPKIENGLPLVF